MKQTLRTDLMQTTLEDFVEHFERALRNESRALLGEYSVHLWGAWGKETSKTYGVGWEGDKLVGLDPANEPFRPYIRCNPGDQGATGRSWWIHTNDDGSRERQAAMIKAVRFQTDRLRVTVREREPVDGIGYGARLVMWLEGWIGPDTLVNQVEIPMPEEMPDLTARETEVALLLAEGLNYEQIASQLVISAHTAKRHAYNIAKKFGIYGGITAQQRHARLLQMWKVLV